MHFFIVEVYLFCKMCLELPCIRMIAGDILRIFSSCLPRASFLEALEEELSFGSAVSP